MIRKILLVDAVLLAIAAVTALVGVVGDKETATQLGMLGLAVGIAIGLLASIQLQQSIRSDARLIRERSGKFAEQLNDVAVRIRRIDQEIHHGPVSRLADRHSQVEYSLVEQHNRLDAIASALADVLESVEGLGTDNRAMHELSLAQIIAAGQQTQPPPTVQHDG